MNKATPPLRLKTAELQERNGCGDRRSPDPESEKLLAKDDKQHLDQHRLQSGEDKCSSPANCY